MAQLYKRKFKNFFIKKNFQGRTMLAVFVAALISCLFYIVVFGFFSADTMTISYKNNALHMGQTPIMLLKNALAANWVFIVTCGTLLIIASIIGTHRIAGPLFRFEKVLDNMIDKNLKETITLREKDEGKDLAQKINTFNTTLSEDIKHLNRYSQAVNDLVTQYSSLQSSNISAEEIRSICEAIKSNNDKMKTLLGSYQLTDD